MSDLSNINFASLTPAQFEEVLPDLFANAEGKVSEDPRLQSFFASYPDSVALVRDLETIAQTAKDLFEPNHEPSDDLWQKIEGRLGSTDGSVNLSE